VSKFALRSKTILINLAYLVVALLPLLLDSLQLAQDNLGQLQVLTSPKVYAVIAFTLPIVNLILRKLTTQPIHFRRPPDMGAGGKT
jgi:hypothetical protein